MLQALSNFNSSIEEGAVYKRPVSGSMTETAEVLEVARDKMGIPHVRFQLSVAYGSVGTAIEQRTLSLDTFYARYHNKA